MLICITYPIGILVEALIIIPLGYIAYNDITFSLKVVRIQDKDYGYQCNASYDNNSEDIEWLTYGIGAFIDILFTVLSVCLLIYKFAVIIQQSAQQQSLIRHVPRYINRIFKTVHVAKMLSTYLYDNNNLLF